MKRARLFGVLLIVLFPCICVVASVAVAEETIKVLIVDGFSNHDWERSTRCIRAILERAGGVDVTVSTYPADGSPEEVEAWNPRFADFDAVVQTCNNINRGPRWPRAVEVALETYVSGGGGLLVFHSANNSFPKWDAYNQMIGLGWRDRTFGQAITVKEGGTLVRVPAGEGGNTGHGPRINALVTRLGEHPIHAGLPRQWVAADIEVYRYARGPAENLTVLSYAKDPQLGIDFPVEWAVAYGKGRVYSSTLGHLWRDQADPEGIRCAAFQTLLPRTVQWLAGRKVDASVPEDFPSKDAPRLRAYPLAK